MGLAMQWRLTKVWAAGVRELRAWAAATTAKAVAARRDLGDFEQVAAGVCKLEAWRRRQRD